MDPNVTLSDLEQVALARAVEKAIQESVREAVLMHKRAGNPVAGWKDGRVIWVQPDEIDVGDDQSESNGQNGVDDSP